MAISFDSRFAVANEQLPNPAGEPGGFSRLWLFDLHLGTVAQLLPDFVTAGNGGVDWDRDGFIYVAAKRVNGTGLQRLLNTPLAGEADVSISEDGSLIAYVSQPLDVAASRTEIWVMSSNGSNPRLVFRAGEVRIASAHDPETSPDNRKIVFSIVNSSVPPNFPMIPGANTAHDIWQMNLDGSEAGRLTRPGPISITPDWKNGISLVGPDVGEQSQRRIKPAANIAKWIP